MRGANAGYTISTHALTWSATGEGVRVHLLQLVISTHALTWSATRARRAASAVWTISTHALTWSATGSAKEPSRRGAISTHALTWSATSENRLAHIAKSHFNSRAHVERDRCACGRSSCQMRDFNSRAHVERDGYPADSCAAVVISTHALTWSATLSFRTMDVATIFQLTRSRGARRKLTDRTDKIGKFQLTRSRGARPYSPLQYTIFKPFQLTRSRGARRDTPRRAGVLLSFQLTRSRGARPRRLDSLASHVNFNSRAHVERDPFPPLITPPLLSFQLTRSRGARPALVRQLAVLCRISTHALTWSATRECRRNIFLSITISTHALTWSAT